MSAKASEYIKSEDFFRKLEDFIGGDSFEINEVRLKQHHEIVSKLEGAAAASNILPMIDHTLSDEAIINDLRDKSKTINEEQRAGLDRWKSIKLIRNFDSPYLIAAEGFISLLPQHATARQIMAFANSHFIGEQYGQFFRHLHIAAKGTEFENSGQFGLVSDTLAAQILFYSAVVGCLSHKEKFFRHDKATFKKIAQFAPEEISKVRNELEKFLVTVYDMAEKENNSALKIAVLESYDFVCDGKCKNTLVVKTAGKLQHHKAIEKNETTKY